MEEQLNVTYLILDGHVEVYKYRYLYFTMFFLVYLLIICSNCTIVYLIWKHQNLHEPMYIFIAALLLNSVLLSTNIYPKLLIDVLSEKQIISYQACIVQYSLFYALGGSEFLLLATMAYDRYVSICKPLQYPTIMTKKNVSILLALTWLLSPCPQVGLSMMCANQKLCGFTLKVIFCNNTIYKLFCATSRAVTVYGLFILLNVVVFPVFFIIFTYIRILIICYHSRGEVRKKAAQTCLPHLLVLISSFCLFVCDVVTVRLEYDFSKTARLIMSLQLVLYNPLFNPLIYGLKMKEIYKHLKRLFCQGKLNQGD
ncbi:Olfactory receptor 11A1 Hs6M1-18 Olfactory receptor 11A2 Olfactory receptor OR6-30 [Channa argus]|uniref:Olfactory receptor n=1 Tax=Channa argus TaxID=215402 RepID=A0A6G1PW51_CHAAH|nr:Olfactory receptor 11A1 Hs6M1-18 Olfactory receptor 11A2 Olfactory receptor OR6-30 [Channa argus]